MIKSVLLFFLLFPLILFAQKNEPGKSLSIKKAVGKIELDGKATEPDWAAASIAKDFFLNYPVDTTRAPYQTEVRVTFDDHHLFFFITCYDDSKPYIVQSLRRDFDYNNNDNVAIVLGPYNDKFNGFFFCITPYNVQMEGTVSSGGNSDDAFSDKWDNKWYSKTHRYDDRWEAELMIPFKSFRHKHGETTWNINFLRWDRKHNQASSWIATPIQFKLGSLAYSGNLTWQTPPPSGGPNISLIPYVSGISSVDKETTPIERSNNVQTGFDAKIGVSPSLNIDLTVNPDFSQVEVDQQVINLTRFEYRFPERRQFFLENSDLYERSGFPESRPFFSRRIGLAQDTSGLLRQVPILYGARVSGSFNSKWRLNVMNLQTKKDLSLGLPAQNYTIAAVQRNFWKQSNITIAYVDKQSLNVSFGDSLKYFNRELWKFNQFGKRKLNYFNRAVCADVDFLTPDNRWYVSYYYEKSFDNFGSGAQDSWGQFYSYTKKHFNFGAGQFYVDKNFNAETGYVPSHGVYPGMLNSFFNPSLIFYPKKVIATMGPYMNFTMINTPNKTITDKIMMLGYAINFLNTSYLVMEYDYTFQRLTNSFNPVDSDRYLNFQTNELYQWSNAFFAYASDQRKVFRYTVKGSTGAFYNGQLHSLTSDLNYRFQPFGSVSLSVIFNKIDLPDNYGKAEQYILRPRVDLTFTDKLFFTSTIQYNTRADNVNLNARFQYRYKPASDFFIVYTENYFPGDFKTKNRALVFKLTYWLNI